MTTEIKVPALPESVSDATVAQWYKKEGDFIAADENLLDLETDKVMLEVPSTVSGTIEKILQPEGSVVEADTLLAVIKEGDAPAASSDAGTDAVASEAPAAAEAAPQTAAAPATDDAALQALSPAVRQLVASNNLDVSKIHGSGKNGAITKADVEAFMSGGSSSSAAATRAAPAAGSRTEERVPMSRLRARVAERLLAVKHETAMLTTFNEVDMSAVMNLRKQYKDKFEKVHDTRLGFMSFFVKASVEALKSFPAVNAYIDGSDMVYHNFFDIGIAVGSDRGLVVPILRNAEDMSMADMEKQIRDFGVRAQTGKISIEEMTGGTFTITNGGTFGSMLSTPILNAPQSAILGMHNIVQRAVVVDGEIVARPMMYLALSYDHRIVDGREAVQFLVTIKEMLEDPARLVLEV